MNKRLEKAAVLILQAKQEMLGWEDIHDPVEQRKQMVRAAKRLREAADVLDDHGGLAE
jgi:hypothetical protein